MSSRKILHCEGDRHYFIKKIVRPYFQLRKDEHYKDLNAAISKDMAKSNRESAVEEAGRLFTYLFQISKFYNDSKIDQPALRPKSDSAWLRVVLRSLLVLTLNPHLTCLNHTDHLREEEIYRIDHYLGKLGVQALYDFRVKNRTCTSHT